MNLKPLNKHLVARPFVEERKQGSLILTKESPRWIFDVIAVADDIDNVRVGDRIVIEEYRMTEVEVYEEKYCIIPIKHVIAVLV